MSAERSLAPDLATGTRTDELLSAGTRWLDASSESPRLDAELLLAHALDKPRTYLYQTLSAAGSGRSSGSLRSPARPACSPSPTGTDHRHTRILVVWPEGHRRHPDTTTRETELLVELALKQIPPDRQHAIADLGTGTGAVAIAIARERPQCTVFATDLSPEALAVAMQNAAGLGTCNISFHAGDWFSALTGKKFAVVVSNPPYIADDEWSETDPGLGFEPRLALSGGPDGLADIRRIVSAAPAHLENGGWLLLEHGFRQAVAVQNLLRQAGFESIATHCDLAGQSRVTEGRLPP
jgi:release factor glutamine methyltransferase